MSTLTVFEKFFHEGVSRLASRLPLCLGDLESNEKGEWYQVIAGQKATQTLGSVSTSLAYNVIFKCFTDAIHKEGKHEDLEKRSYEMLSVIAKKGEERCSTNATKIGKVIDYKLDNMSVCLVSAEPNSDKFNILINKQYRRADYTIFFLEKTTEVYLTLTHVNFIHRDNFSY